MNKQPVGCFVTLRRCPGLVCGASVGLKKPAQALFHSEPIPHAADAGAEFVFTEGLADEVACPELEADDDVDLLAFCGEK